MFDASRRRTTVFDDERSLSTTNYTKPIGRDAEVERIADAVQPLVEKQDPENLFVYGPAGAGKSTCVHHVFNKLSEETRVRTVIINCWKYNTRSSLLTQLLVELGYPALRKGKPIDELLTLLSETIEKSHGVAVALDEFDQLEDQNEIAYDLHELNVETDSHCGMVLVSNKPPSNIELDQRTRSRLSYHELHFDPYETDDLQQILEQRAEDAFRRNTITDDAIEAIAEAVAEETEIGEGDCRHALEVLHRAGREADREQADKVTVAHVERALNPARF